MYQEKSNLKKVIMIIEKEMINKKTVLMKEIVEEMWKNARASNREDLLPNWSSVNTNKHRKQLIFEKTKNLGRN